MCRLQLNAACEWLLERTLELCVQMNAWESLFTQQAVRTASKPAWRTAIYSVSGIGRSVRIPHILVSKNAHVIFPIWPPHQTMTWVNCNKLNHSYWDFPRVQCCVQEPFLLNRLTLPLQECQFQLVWTSLLLSCGRLEICESIWQSDRVHSVFSVHLIICLCRGRKWLRKYFACRFIYQKYRCVTNAAWSTPYWIFRSPLPAGNVFLQITLQKTLE